MLNSFCKGGFIIKPEIKFINDKVVKKILNSEKEECREYLVRIISGVTGMDYNILKDNIELITPNISGNVNIVNSTVDSICKDKNNYYNIEINYNNSKVVEVKNNVYVYNMILRQVKRKEDYNKVSPVIQININNYDKFKEERFVYKSQMKETRSGKIRDELITVYDINLEYLSNIDYNKIKKGKSYNLEKLLYIFICGDERILDYIYNGDEIMLEIKEEFRSEIKELDDMLYYDPEELRRMIAEEEYKDAIEEGRRKGLEEGLKEGKKQGIKEGIKQGIEEGKQKNQEEIVKNMIDKKFDDNTIKSILKIEDEVLNKIKRELDI